MRVLYEEEWTEIEKNGTAEVYPPTMTGISGLTLPKDCYTV